MGAIPDKMVRAFEKSAWWESSSHGATQMSSDAPTNEWLEAAGLNFTVRGAKTAYQSETGEWIELPNRQTLMASDGGDLGHFTKRYKIHQPHEIDAAFTRILQADSRFKRETAGRMKGGALIWMLARFHEDTDVIGAPHRRYALWGTSYNGQWSTFGSATNVCAVCENTVEASIFGGAPAIRVPHSQPFHAIKQLEAVEALAKIAMGFEQYKAVAEALQKIAMNEREIEAMLANLSGLTDEVETDDNSKKKDARKRGIYKTMRQSLDETHNNECRDAGWTAWTAFNSVTRYVDHMRGTRVMKGTGETEAQNRLFSANFGSGASMKKEAIQLLLPDHTKIVQTVADQFAAKRPKKVLVPA